MDGIEVAHLALVRDKKFSDHLAEGCYPIAIDGTQKLVGKLPFDEQRLEREVGSGHVAAIGLLTGEKPVTYPTR